jgi:murein DD-endopeptidase MepM/ murein hydrolase activator NlpD
VTLDTLQPGETLSELFARHGVTSFDFAAFHPDSGLDPRRARAGLVFAFRQLVTDSVPTRISVRRGPEERLHYERLGARWRSRAEAIAWSSEPVRVEGPIGDALYLALDANIPDGVLGVSERVRMAGNLAEIYDWTVDFTRDIRPGDYFRVVIERRMSEEGEVRLGRIYAADLTITGKHLLAYRFESEDGTTGYFDEQGRSLRRAFLRAPLEFRRISSRFSSARRHPILGRVRRHQGTDYAADRGTPVRATADGVVLRAGRVSTYGNLVELRHAKGITTRYGHLQRTAVRTGSRVVQGQIIGYVGATGLANGPHLHYEFRINGVAKDHRRVDLGTGDPVPEKDRPAFERERARLDPLLQTPVRDTTATGE